MLSIFSNLRDINSLSVFVRLTFAFICGGLIGLERSYKNRPAGFRTHILVCIAGTVASMTGLFLYLNLHFPTDISRIGAQVVSGLGFIGAGTIFVTKRPTVKGLTTAAGLWVSGIIWLSIGAGFYEGALLATVLVLLTEIYFTKIVHGMKHRQEFSLDLYYSQKPALDQVMRYCKDNRLAIRNLHVESSGDTTVPLYEAILVLRPRKKIDHDQLLTHILSIDGINAVHEL